MSEFDFLAVAKDLAQEAACVVLELQKKPLSQSRKEDKSLVTEADLQSDRIIREGLLKKFPEHGILTEEGGFLGKQGSDWVWVVDPLDGTKAYAKGISGFSVMIGLLKEGSPYLGVVADPIEGRIYEAIKGKGASLIQGMKKTSLYVSERSRFDVMPIATSTGFPEAAKEKLKSTLQGSFCQPINSVGIKVGLLVRQEADIYINHHAVHYWDTCAPQIILEEAGGIFTKMDGSPLGYDLTSDHDHHALTLASNGTRHEEICHLLTSLTASLKKDLGSTIS